MAAGRRAASATESLLANEAKVVGETKVGEVRSECGDCKMVVGRMDKAMQCELCELWFHCKCESISEDSYKLMGQDKIHFYCGRCDKAAGKILKTVLGIQARQTKMEGELNKVKGEVEEINKRPYVVQEQLQEVVQHFESEIEDVKKAVLKGSQDVEKDNPEVQTLQSELAELKSGMTSQLNTTVKEMKEEVEESLEIERRKMNLVIHGLKDEDAEADVDEVIKLFEDGLKMDYLRHVDKIMRIGRRVTENKPRPLKIILKGLDSRKEILARTKNLKEIDTFSKVFITPDLTRKQQERDKELRSQLRRIRDEGEMGARIRYGKVVKNGKGRREVVLYQPTQ
jgi:hypothetical protein